MEEMLTLLRENNSMLKFICNYLISQGSAEFQDNKNLMINILADLFVDKLNNRNNG